MKFGYYALLGYCQRVVEIPYRRFGTDKLSRIVGKELTTTRCLIVQKIAVLVYCAAEAQNHP